MKNHGHFNIIFENIKDKVDVRIGTQVTSEDFIRDAITVSGSIKIPNTKHKFICYEKLSEYCISMANFDILKATSDNIRFQVTKVFWRLNQKRISHGLKSWIY